MAGVGAPEAVGNELLDGLSQEFLASIAEEFLGLCINEDDSPLLIHHDHGVGGGFDGQTEEVVSQFSLAHRDGPVLDTAASIASQEMARSELVGGLVDRMAPDAF